MVHHATKRDVVAEFRRGEIVQAARTVFARRGYQSATVDDIAEEARIAKGTLYLYFKSKEEIYLSALMKDVGDLQADAEKRIAAASGARDKLREFVAVRMEHSERNADFWRIYFSEFYGLASSPAVNSKPFQAAVQRSVLQLRKIIEAGIAAGEIRKLPLDRTAFAVMDLTRSVIERRLMGFVKGKPADDCAFVVDLLWKGLAPGKR